MFYYTYMLKSISRGVKKTYVGYTNNVNKRLEKHNSNKGAKYTRNRRPVNLVYLEKNHDKSTASKREIFIKKLSRVDKLKLIRTEYLK